MAESPFRELLERSLAGLAQDSPFHHQRVGELLAGRTLRLVVDAPFRLDDRLHTRADGPCDVEASCAPDELTCILRGLTPLTEAVASGRIELTGELDAVLACFDALEAWLHGAVRCPAQATLLDEYLERNP